MSNAREKDSSYTVFPFSVMTCIDEMFVRSMPMIPKTILTVTPFSSLICTGTLAVGTGVVGTNGMSTVDDLNGK
jgi:ABC-type phosphate/phosphonate transport system permease subunit